MIYREAVRRYGHRLFPWKGESTMDAQEFVDGLFFGGGTDMVDADGHINDFDHAHTPEDKAPDCPACYGTWEG